MASDDHGCSVAKEALAQVTELRLLHNALERKADRAEMDRVRLGDRVTLVEERVADHEVSSREAVDHLTRVVDELRNTVIDAMERPPVPSGMTFVKSWRETPIKTKSGILASLIALLMAPDVIRPLLNSLFKLLAHVVARLLAG